MQLQWIAVGESCMTINALRRHVRSAPSTPYSSERSNVDHFLYFEKTQYSDMLDERFLESTPRGTIHRKVKSHQDFRHAPHPYYEFSHFDPLDFADRKTIQRRIDRMINLRKCDTHKVFVYSHRSPIGYQANTGSRIANALSCVNNLYSHCRSISITQHLVQNPNQRGIKMQKVSDDIIFYTVYSNQYWCGDPHILFGHHDDDLLSLVFLSCAKIFGFQLDQAGLL